MLAAGWQPPKKRVIETDEEKDRRLALARTTKEQAAQAVRDARPHYVADIRTRARESVHFVECICGWRFNGRDAEGLARGFGVHIWEVRGKKPEEVE